MTRLGITVPHSLVGLASTFSQALGVISIRIQGCASLVIMLFYVCLAVLQVSELFSHVCVCNLFAVFAQRCSLLGSFHGCFTLLLQSTSHFCCGGRSHDAHDSKRHLLRSTWSYEAIV